LEYHAFRNDKQCPVTHEVQFWTELQYDRRTTVNTAETDLLN